MLAALTGLDSSVGAGEGRHGHSRHAFTADVLLSSFSRVQASGEQWSQQLEDQLCYEVKTLLLAGHETSASMLTWSVLELIQHPAAAEQVRSYVRSPGCGSKSAARL